MCSENMQQIYRRTPMPKWIYILRSNYNKKPHFGMVVLLQICYIFSEHLLLRTPHDRTATLYFPCANKNWNLYRQGLWTALSRRLWVDGALFFCWRGCSSDITSSYFFRPSKVWSILHHGSVGASSE